MVLVQILGLPGTGSFIAVCVVTSLVALLRQRAAGGSNGRQRRLSSEQDRCRLGRPSTELHANLEAGDDGNGHGTVTRPLDGPAAVDTTDGQSDVGDTVSGRLLDAGSLVCLFTPQGELVTVTRAGRCWELRTISPTATPPGYPEGSGVRLPFFPIESIFLVLRNGDKMGFRSLGAEGRVLQAVRRPREPHRVLNYNFGAWESWRVGDSGAVVNCKWQHKRLGLSVQELRIMALQDVRDAERQHLHATRDLQTKLHMVGQQLEEAEGRLSDLVQASHRQSQTQAAAAEELAARLSEAERQRDAAAGEAVRRSAAVGHFESRLGSLAAERDRLLDAVEDEQRRVRDLEEQLRATSSVHRSQVEELTAQLQRLQQQGQQGSQRGEQAEAALQQLQGELRDRETQLEQARTAMQQLHGANMALVADKDAEIRDLQRQLAELQRQLAAAGTTPGPSGTSHGGVPSLATQHQHQQHQQPPYNNGSGGYYKHAGSNDAVGVVLGSPPGGNTSRSSPAAARPGTSSRGHEARAPRQLPSGGTTPRGGNSMGPYEGRAPRQQLLPSGSTTPRGGNSVVGAYPDTPDHEQQQQGGQAQRGFPFMQGLGADTAGVVLGPAAMPVATSALFNLLGGGGGGGGAFGDGGHGVSPGSSGMVTPRVVSSAEFQRASSVVSSHRETVGDDDSRSLMSESEIGDSVSVRGGGVDATAQGGDQARSTAGGMFGRGTTQQQADQAWVPTRSSFLGRDLPSLDSLLN